MQAYSQWGDVREFDTEGVLWMTEMALHLMSIIDIDSVRLRRFD